MSVEADRKSKGSGTRPSASHLITHPSAALTLPLCGGSRMDGVSRLFTTRFRVCGGKNSQKATAGIVVTDPNSAVADITKY